VIHRPAREAFLRLLLTIAFLISPGAIMRAQIELPMSMPYADERSICSKSPATRNAGSDATSCCKIGLLSMYGPPPRRERRVSLFKMRLLCDRHHRAHLL
jgi:hypothetical protein